VVPLLTGGGSPLKFVEALGRGMPVVATSHAAALIEPGRSGEHFLAADDAEGFAAALVSALKGEAEELGERGRAMAEREFSIEALERELRCPTAAE
jgi:glycosyltransferase involved in cell wall biosynthesis